MNKVIRNIFIVIASIILTFTLYIGIDCVRLKHAKFETKPLLVLKEQKIDYKNKSVTKYTGIGYTVTYGSDNSAEFKLFDEIMIWAWIE